MHASHRAASTDQKQIRIFQLHAMIILIATNKIFAYEAIENNTIDFLLELPGRRFIRVHRSCLVAMDKIISIEKQQIHVKDKVIPVGSIYLPAFMKKISKMGNH
jgi:DNA-binding LytR/AlgR family response regulator